MSTVPQIGVAISTTGDDHRMRFLETTVRGWRRALSGISPLAPIVVTVDGTAETARKVWERVAVSDQLTSIYQVGQPANDLDAGRTREGRQGVAVNKNTGIELLMDWLKPGWIPLDHLFLSDDDTYPRSATAIYDHLAAPLEHSMVCWGRHRRPVIRETNGARYAEWNWPRGVVLYTTRKVIDTVGGMVEEFGPGGHEHVEWSRRIHQAGLTPAPYCSPLSNIQRLDLLWHAEDMPRPNEAISQLRRRRAQITSVRREQGDWEKIEKIMAARDGHPDYVPFRAHANGRASATLCNDLMGRGASDAGSNE